MELTLDQLLAAEVGDFDQQQRRVLDALDNIITSDLLQAYSTSVTVKPAAQQLRAWLVSFPENMQQTTRRLTDSLKARVCFAENGMKLLLAYANASLESARDFRRLVNAIDMEIETATPATATEIGGKRTLERAEVDPVLSNRLENARRSGLLLRDSLQAVLGAKQATLISLLAEWFAFVTYTTPTRLKSIDTSLTKANADFLTSITQV